MIPLRISIFGLGYVGVVSAACLAELGHRIVGVDPQSAKVDLINDGQSPILERELPQLVHSAVQAGRLRATTSPVDAVRDSDLSIVCVGTPSRADGDIDLAYVSSACGEIGRALRDKRSHHVVVVRSTVAPGATRRIVIPTLEVASGRAAGADFGVVMHPEFLREGSAVADFRDPARIVVGELDEASGDAVAGMYGDSLPTRIVRTTIETAEVIKYADNAWHALKICFANEMGAICDASGVDASALMRMFAEDRKLNLSAAYLTPGAAFGGSCLPKDVRALTALAVKSQVATPLLSAILKSNEAQQDRALRAIRASGARRIGFLGLAFKAGTDDVRESPTITLVQALVADGYPVAIHDAHVVLHRMIGANQHHLLSLLPDFVRYSRQDPREVIAESDVVVVSHDTAEYREVLANCPKPVEIVDLAGAFRHGVVARV